MADLDILIEDEDDQGDKCTHDTRIYTLGSTAVPGHIRKKSFLSVKCADCNKIVKMVE